MDFLLSLQRKIIPNFIRNRFAGRIELQKVVANTGWLVFDAVSQIIINLFVSVQVARYLGPELRGIMIYANSFVSLFVSLSALGLGAIVIRELVREPEAKGELMGTVFVAELVCYILFLPLIIVSVLILRAGEPLVQWAVIILAIGSLFSTSRIFNFWFRSQLQSKYAVWASRIVEFIIAGFKIILLVIQAPLLLFITVSALQIVMYFFAKLVFYTKTGERIRTWRFNASRARTLLRDGWPLALSLFAITLYTEIDNLMLGQLMDNKAVGLYGEAARVSKMWYFIPVAIASSAYPVLVRAHENITQHNYNQRVQQFFDVLAIVGYASAIPASLLAPFAVSLVYGPDYAETGRVLTIYVWTFVFVALREGMNRWLMVDNLTLYSMWSALIGAGFNIGLNFMLVPKYGVIGAAWATLISNFFAIYLLCLAVPRLRPLFRQLVQALFAPLHLRSLLSKL
jgi:PST family polysaccharide transporter